MTQISRRAALSGLGAGAAALAMPGVASAQEPVNAGFITIGPIGDFGWSTMHDVGRKRVEEVLGARVRTHLVERVAVNDMPRVATQLARSQNCRIIFTTSFSYMNPTVQVAQQLPDVRFEHATGVRRADNLAIYNARFYEGRYVCGLIAARKSRSGTIGYIASFPVPEVVHAINAVMRGAWSVRPDLKIRIVWVNAWFDPGREADAARALIDQGCDVICQHTDSPAPLQIANERNVFGFGQASDMTRFAPRAHLTSIVNNWGDYYVDRVRAVMENRWSSTDTWGGLNSGMVRLAEFTNMTDGEIREARAAVEAISSGRLHPFQGPIVRADGTEAVPASRAMTDDELRSMNYFVRGVDNPLPS